tara:strand:- start:332 stop:1156 length:825 start_codon:yes stop_codon:yes gene_type:complete
MSNDITVIATLYKTPIKMIKNFNHYKKYKSIFFDQESNGKFKNKMKKILNFKFKYYYSLKNIGLSKSSNLLLSKVKTKYCLFTQPDILIEEKSINMLIRAIKLQKDAIFVGPKNVKNKRFKKLNKYPKYKIVNNLKAACMLCDVKKLRKIGFFDNDFFLYWEDVYLMKKISKTNYKMLLVNNAYAFHESSKSSEDNLKTNFIRNSNFMYGELLYDYKLNKLRFLKVFRKFFQNIFYFLFNILKFKLEDVIKNLAKLAGIVKFLRFYLTKGTKKI